LVSVDGDPPGGIGELRKVARVVELGAAYRPSEVYATLGIAPFAAPARMASM
jgi:hypothetical protein